MVRRYGKDKKPSEEVSADASRYGEERPSEVKTTGIRLGKQRLKSSSTQQRGYAKPARRKPARRKPVGQSSKTLPNSNFPHLLYYKTLLTIGRFCGFATDSPFDVNFFLKNDDIDHQQVFVALCECEDIQGADVERMTLSNTGVKKAKALHAIATEGVHP